MNPAEKTRENRYRRMLTRRGYTLSRSRTRDTRALAYGRYYVTTQREELQVCELPDLDAVGRWLETAPTSEKWAADELSNNYTVEDVTGDDLQAMRLRALRWNEA